MSSLHLAVTAAVADMETTVESSGHATDQESPSACGDNCLMTRESSLNTVIPESVGDPAESALLAKPPATRSKSEGESSRSTQVSAELAMTARVTFATDSSGTDHPLQANSAAETELTAAEIEMLTMDFLFADVAAKSTGPSGALGHARL